MNLRNDLKISLRRTVELANYCMMHVGGPAEFFASPTCEDELLEAIEFAKQEGLPFVILGNGSNVIFPDEGYPGLVICMRHYEENQFTFDKTVPNAMVSSGVNLYRFVLACRDHGFAGTEFLVGIPGTVGGALLMNAGYSRHPGQRNQIGDLVSEVTVVDYQGAKHRLNKSELQFKYRSSNLGDKIILGAQISLWRRNYMDIDAEIGANIAHRNKKQDLSFPSAGSFFKNPERPHRHAGKLIEKLGLKGMRVGDAMVSHKHGNFIVNLGSAKSSDVIELMQKIQKAVFDATEILLEPEVRIITKP